ncbi:MAG TPA: NAD(P)/FAD-dependent oxidoreductase [Acidimicrobiales bacterium]|jgi:protoporphyrinogen oxidase|nr:NAD(P)/FAD-dependent oxidoreductase [Acidimicrobiales bacterium]
MAEAAPVVIAGAGPGGLTAAYLLTQRGEHPVVLECDDVVGGISRTVVRDGWRFDLGGHRFFTKVPEVEALWHEILPEGDFLLRPRMSRIFYNGKYIDYPLKAMNALRQLGLWESILCGFSYVWARIRPPKNEDNYENWLVARFGWRLYRTFFKTYTERVWGVPVSDMPADWAAQRVKNLDLRKAVFNAIMPKRNQTEITSLIEEFQYPKYGPGMMWEVCAEKVQAAGGTLVMEARLTQIHVADGKAHSVTYEHDGVSVDQPASHVISTMPLRELVHCLTPPPPAEVLAAGDGLHYRDYLTVALVVPESRSFPDNWIYIHDPGVEVGRIQNYGSWSPFLVKDGRTCLGLEYFVFEGDDMWETADDALIAMATKELGLLGLSEPGDVEQGYVVRVKKAYPYYDFTYKANVDLIRRYLETQAPNVHLVGRNGMHRYNNQDHSMYTAMLTVENMYGAEHDIWSVNVEEEYHESTTAPSSGGTGGTGRDAPILPWPPAPASSTSTSTPSSPSPSS